MTHVGAPGRSRTSLWVVCDGHMGPEVARLTSNNLMDLVLSIAPTKVPDFRDDTALEEYCEALRKAIAQACVSLDNQSIIAQTSGVQSGDSMFAKSFLPFAVSKFD